MDGTEKKSSPKKGKNAEPTVKDKILVFWKGVKAEFKKIIWPDKDRLIRETAAVLIISVILGGFIRIYDIVCQYIINFIK